MQHAVEHLDADKIKEIVALLATRIRERFPECGLSKLCDHLLEVSKETKAEVGLLVKPIYKIRVISYSLITMIVLMFLATVFYALMKSGIAIPGLGELVAFSEPGLNIIVLAGAGIYFLSRLETKIKRRRTLHYLHELRSLAHIIDLHQLTKDPERYMAGWVKTKSSPENDMSPFEMGRYLDYASEMLSVVSKLAAIYVQDFDDAVTLAAVNEVEALTSGLSSKIWQKLMILYSTSGDSFK